MPVDLIREYYGDEIAIYYEWMNFFLKWMSAPAIIGLIIIAFNLVWFEPETSPLNALFSIFMSIWAFLFAI